MARAAGPLASRYASPRAAAAALAPVLPACRWHARLSRYPYGSGRRRARLLLPPGAVGVSCVCVQREAAVWRTRIAAVAGDRHPLGVAFPIRARSSPVHFPAFFSLFVTPALALYGVDQVTVRV